MCVCFGSFVVPRALFSLLTHTHTLPTTNPLFSHSDKSSGSTESDAEPLSLLQINTRAMTIQTSQFSGVFNKTEDVNGRSSSWINLNAYRGQTLTRYRNGITELVASVQLLVHSPDPVWDGQSFVKHTWYFPSDLSLWPTETNKLHRVDWDSHQQNATPSSAKYVKTLLICFPICYILRKCKCFLNSVHLQHFFVCVTSLTPWYMPKQAWRWTAGRTVHILHYTTLGVSIHGQVHTGCPQMSVKMFLQTITGMVDDKM